MLLPDAAPDGEVYLTTVQAAEAMSVTPRTVRYWVASGYLPEAVPGRKGRGGSALYAFSAVTGAERLARDAAAATRFQSVA
jgi:excisionase family DNA binding protein